jgi:hypothetical protein
MSEAPGSERGQRPIYLLRITQTRAVNDVRALRWLLKKMLRSLGWRALSVEEEPQQ